MLHCRAMMELTDEEQAQLIQDIATRAGTAKQIASWYELSVTELKQFVEDNREVLEAFQKVLPIQSEIDSGDVTPQQLDDLWITKKFERLSRYQTVSELLYKDLIKGSLAGSELATAAREFRSYAQLAANELGQLLHRGAGDSGDGDSLAIDIRGVDMDNLR